MDCAISKVSASAFAHPYKSDRGDVTNSQKEIGPCFGSGPGGRPRSSSSVSLAIEGDGAPQGAWPGFRQTGPGVRGSRASPDTPGSGREASRPAPCGAPTRHLGLYAFDRGRTGPAPNGRRGCPSTARGRGCVLHRSQVPLPVPAFKTPHECAPRRVDRDMSRLAKISPDVKSRFRY